MFSRLTALILTLCIGLPMCWCCIAAPQQEEEVVASCCAKKHHPASEHVPSHSKEPDCPCARHEASRDVASTFIQAPVPSFKLLAEPVWAPIAQEILPPVSLETHAPRHDHGPPLHAPPLYTRHCALLI